MPRKKTAKKDPGYSRKPQYTRLHDPPGGSLTPQQKFEVGHIVLCPQSTSLTTTTQAVHDGLGVDRRAVEIFRKASPRVNKAGNTLLQSTLSLMLFLARLVGLGFILSL